MKADIIILHQEPHFEKGYLLAIQIEYQEFFKCKCNEATNCSSENAVRVCKKMFLYLIQGIILAGTVKMNITINYL